MLAKIATGVVLYLLLLLGGFMFGYFVIHPIVQHISG